MGVLTNEQIIAADKQGLKPGDIDPALEGLDWRKDFAQTFQQQPVSYSEEATRTYESSKKLGKKGLIDSLKGLGAFLYNNPISPDILGPQPQPEDLPYQVPEPTQWQKNPLLGALQAASRANIPTPQETPTTFGGKAITKGAEWGAQLLPFLVAPQAAGIPLLAAMGAGSGYSQALEQGKTPEQAAVDFGLGGAGGAIMGKGFHMAQKLGPLAQGLSLPVLGRTMGTLESGYQAYEQNKPIVQAIKDYWVSPENVGQGLMETLLGLSGSLGRAKVRDWYEGKPEGKTVSPEEPPPPPFDPLFIAPQFLEGPKRQLPRGDVIPQPKPTFDISERVPTPAKGQRLWEVLKSEGGYIDVSPEDISRLGEQFQSMLSKAKLSPNMRQEVDKSIDAFIGDAFPYSQGSRETKLAVLQIARQHNIPIRAEGGKMRVSGSAELGVGLEEALNNNNPNLFRREIGILKFPEYSQELRQEGKTPAQTFFEKLKRPLKEERGAILGTELRGSELGKEIAADMPPQRNEKGQPLYQDVRLKEPLKVEPAPQTTTGLLGKVGSKAEKFMSRSMVADVAASPAYFADSVAKEFGIKGNYVHELNDTSRVANTNVQNDLGWFVERAKAAGLDLKKSTKTAKTFIDEAYKTIWNKKDMSWDEREAKTQELALKYAEKNPNFAIGLAVEDKLPAQLLNNLTPEQKNLVGELKDYNKWQGERRKAEGLNVLGEDELYSAHLLRPILEKYKKEHGYYPDWLGKSGEKQAGGQPYALERAFSKSRQAPSRIEKSFDYIPDIVTKMLYQAGYNNRAIAQEQFLKRWNPVRDYFGENYKQYGKIKDHLEKDIKDNFFKDRQSWEKWLGRVVSGEVALDIGLSLSTAKKHVLGKGAMIAIEHPLRDLIPGIIQAVKVHTPFVKGWEKDVFKSFAARPDLMKMMEQASNFAETNTIGKGTKAVSIAKWISGQPTMLAESFENAINLFASLAAAERGGLSKEQATRGIWESLHRVSQRSGADTPAYSRGVGRLATLFYQTPAKMMENYGHILTRAMKGEKDSFGRSYQGKVIRGMIVVGALYGLAKETDTDLLASVFHIPGLSKNKEGKRSFSPSPFIQLAGEMKDKGFVGGVGEKFLPQNEVTNIFGSVRKMTGTIPPQYGESRSRFLFGEPYPKSVEARQTQAAFRGETKRNRFDAIHEAEKLLDTDRPDYSKITRVLQEGGVKNTKVVLDHLYDAKKYKAYPHLYQVMSMPPSEFKDYEIYLQKQGQWEQFKANFDDELKRYRQGAK